MGGADLHTNNSKIDGLQDKIDNIQCKNKINEESNLRKFESIREEIASVKDSVTNKIVSQFKPSVDAMREEIQANVNTEINSMKNELREGMGSDLRRLIKDQLILIKIQEDEEADQDKDEARK